MSISLLFKRAILPLYLICGFSSTTHSAVLKKTVVLSTLYAANSLNQNESLSQNSPITYTQHNVLEPFQDNGQWYVHLTEHIDHQNCYHHYLPLFFQKGWSLKRLYQLLPSQRHHRIHILPTRSTRNPYICYIGTNLEGGGNGPSRDSGGSDHDNAPTHSPSPPPSNNNTNPLSTYILDCRAILGTHDQSDDNNDYNYIKNMVSECSIPQITFNRSPSPHNSPLPSPSPPRIASYTPTIYHSYLIPKTEPPQKSFGINVTQQPSQQDLFYQKTSSNLKNWGEEFSSATKNKPSTNFLQNIAPKESVYTKEKKHTTNAKYAWNTPSLLKDQKKKSTPKNKKYQTKKSSSLIKKDGKKSKAQPKKVDKKYPPKRKSVGSKKKSAKSDAKKSSSAIKKDGKKSKAQPKKVDKKYPPKRKSVGSKKKSAKSDAKRSSSVIKKDADKKSLPSSTQDKYSTLVHQVENNPSFQKKRSDVLEKKLEQEKIEQELVTIEQVAENPYAPLSIKQCLKYEELTKQLAKNKQALQHTQEIFQEDPMYKTVLKKGIDLQIEQEYLENRVITNLGSDPEDFFTRDEIKDIAKNNEKHKKESQKRRKQKRVLRDAILREDSPTRGTMVKAFIKGGAKSTKDFVKLPIDATCLAGKVTKNFLKSIYHCRDELGIRDTMKLIDHLCTDGRYKDETEEDYEARILEANQTKKRAQAYQKFYNAQDYHLGKAESAGYWTNEALLFVFGGELIKGGSNLVKGARRVEQGKHLSQEVHIVESALHGITQEEKARKGIQKAEKLTDLLREEEKVRKTAQKIPTKKAAAKPTQNLLKQGGAKKVPRKNLAKKSDLPKQGIQIFQEFPIVKKAVNSNLPHAAQNGVLREVFTDIKAAKKQLKLLSSQITQKGWPKNAIIDPSKLDRVLVPVGKNGVAVYKVQKNGTVILKTVMVKK